MRRLTGVKYCLVAIFIIITMFFTSVSAQAYKSYTFLLDGKIVNFISEVRNINNTIIVPLGEAARLFNASVTTVTQKRTMRCTKEHRIIDMTVKSKYAMVNGKKTKIPVVFRIINGKYYVPIRFLAENLGYNVTWKDGKINMNSGPIVFIGDSLTYLYDFNSYFPGKNIINKGVSGNLTFDLIKRLKDLKNLKPCKIFLMIGVNDMACAIKKDTMLKNYRTILNTFINDQPWTKIYIQSILPVGQVAIDKNQKLDNSKIDDMNGELKKLSGNLKVEYIDIASLYKDSQGMMDSQFSEDGIHLIHDAYINWADKVKNLI